MLFIGSISAQTIQAENVNIQMPANESSINGINNSNKSQSCGPDTIGYTLAKASGLNSLNINNATSASAAGQYFDAPQSLTISGVSFYAYKIDATGGTTMNCNVEIYAAAADSLPSGAPLAATTITIDTTFAPGTLDALRKSATFSTPITVSNPYVVVISNPTATPMGMIFSDYNAGDGGQEWLGSALIGANWLRSYDINIGGVPLDGDGLIEPHVSYNLTSSYLVDDPCFSLGLSLNFTNTSSPVNFNRMYNQAEYLGSPELSFTWNYGDGSPTENLVDATHTYGSASPYNVTLTDTIYGWSVTCSTDTVVTLGAPPVAAFTSTESGLTSTFTNNSTVSSGATYTWDFGDGNTSTATDPTHTYTTDGTYTVCLTATDPCGSETTCQSVTVSSCANPVVGFTVAGTSPTFNFTNNSTTTGTTTYAWDFGDGNTSSAMNPSHTYTADGTYSVCLVVTDQCGTETSCQNVTVVICTAPVSGFTIDATASPTFSFTNTSTTTGTTTYLWDFGDGNTATTANASHTYTANGTFTVTLTVTDDCGTNTNTSNVSVNTVGIEELSLVDVVVYPNPSKGIFSIKASTDMKNSFITDLTGKLVHTETLSGNEANINTGSLANGSYFLSIYFVDGTSQKVRVEIVK